MRKDAQAKRDAHYATLTADEQPAKLRKDREWKAAQIVQSEERIETAKQTLSLPGASWPRASMA